MLSLYISSLVYTMDNTDQLFYQLRQKHIQTMVAQKFIAQMNQKDAKLLVNNKIKGKYIVNIDYDVRRGIKLIVKGEDPFYENILYSHEQFVNKMLLPILDTPAYTRLKERFTATLLKQNVYQMDYSMGDSSIRYIFSTGKDGLISKIIYYYNGKKEYLLDISWVKINSKYIPNKIKSISYLPTIKIVDFMIENIQIK